MARPDLGPTHGQHDGRHRRTHTRGAQPLLGVGGHAAARAARRRGGRAQLPVLLLRLGFAQQGQHRPQAPRTAWPRCRRPSEYARAAGGSHPVVHRDVVHPSVRGRRRPAPGRRRSPRREEGTAGSDDIVVCGHARAGGAGQGHFHLDRGETRGVGRRSGASFSTVTTRGDWASPTPWPRSTRARRWWTVRSAGSVAAPSRPARAATPRPRTCCSRPGPHWFTPDGLAAMLDLTDKALAELGEPNRSRTAQGARGNATAFEWVVGR